MENKVTPEDMARLAAANNMVAQLREKLELAQQNYKTVALLLQRTYEITDKDSIAPDGTIKRAPAIPATNKAKKA
jgi:hypothetical protein